MHRPFVLDGMFKCSELYFYIKLTEETNRIENNYAESKSQARRQIGDSWGSCKKLGSVHRERLQASKSEFVTVQLTDLLR